MCPFRADGRVCQEVFGRGAESKRSSGVDGCEWECSVFVHELSVCQWLSGESSKCLCAQKRENHVYYSLE